MELLFEYCSSRVVVKSSSSSLCQCIEKELQKFGVTSSVVLPSQASDSASDSLLLQRYDDKWKCFINIDSLEQVTEGDRLTVVSKPIPTSNKVRYKLLGRF